MSKAESLEAISETLLRVVTPGIKPKQLIARVREQHPKASKKDVVRAAFYALIAHSDATPDAARELHDFALSQRNAEEDSPEASASGALS